MPAIRKLLAKTGLTLDQVDAVEVNEAFAPQWLAVQKELGLDLAKSNLNGGAIALGHRKCLTLISLSYQQLCCFELNHLFVLLFLLITSSCSSGRIRSTHTDQSDVRAEAKEWKIRHW